MPSTVCARYWSSCSSASMRADRFVPESVFPIRRARASERGESITMASTGMRTMSPRTTMKAKVISGLPCGSLSRPPWKNVRSRCARRVLRDDVPANPASYPSPARPAKKDATRRSVSRASRSTSPDP